MRDVDQRRFDNQHEIVTAAEAVAMLDVKPATLYAYVSRGLVRRAGAGRYVREDVARLRARRDARSGHGAVAASALSWGEPVLDTSVSEITAEGPRYRGVPLARLRGRTFEDVASLLWQRPYVAPRGSGKGGRSIQALMQIAASIPFETSAEALIARLVGGAKVAPTLARQHRIRFDARIDEALIVCAEHDLNASTFAARVAASAGATLPACITAALATMSGTKHGGESERFEQMLDEAKTLGSASAAIRARMARGDLLAGFGHRLYRDGDPRGAYLVQLAKLPKSHPVMKLIAASNQTPNLDAGLVALRHALKAPRGFAALLFAVGRTAGWIAHIEEQRQRPGLLRPRARYVGTSDKMHAPQST